MIKCNKGAIEINGTLIDLVAEYATLTHCLRDDFAGVASKEEADKIMRRAFDDGLKTEEEMEEEVESKKEMLTPEKAAKRLIQLMEKMMKGEKEDGRDEG